MAFSDKGLAKISHIGLQQARPEIERNILINNELKPIKYITPCTDKEIAEQPSWLESIKRCPGLFPIDKNGGVLFTERPQSTYMKLDQLRIEDIKMSLPEAPVCENKICKIKVQIDHLKIGGKINLNNKDMILNDQPLVFDVKSQPSQPVYYEFNVAVDETNPEAGIRVVPGSSQIHLPPGSAQLSHRDLLPENISKLQSSMAPDFMNQFEKATSELVNGSPRALDNDLKQQQAYWRSQGYTNVSELSSEYVQKRNEALRSLRDSRGKDQVQQMKNILNPNSFWSQSSKFKPVVAQQALHSLGSGLNMDPRGLSILLAGQGLAQNVLNDQIIAPEIGKQIAQRFGDVEKEIAQSLKLAPDAINETIQLPKTHMQDLMNLDVINKKLLSNPNDELLLAMRERVQKRINDSWHEVQGQIVVNRLKEGNKGVSFGLRGRGGVCPRSEVSAGAEHDMDIDIPLSTVNKYLESVSASGALSVCTGVSDVTSNKCLDGHRIQPAQPPKLEYVNGKYYLVANDIQVLNSKTNGSLGSVNSKIEVVPKVCDGGLCFEGKNPDSRSQSLVLRLGDAGTQMDKALVGGFRAANISIPQTNLQTVSIGNDGRIKLSYDLMNK